MISWTLLTAAGSILVAACGGDDSRFGEEDAVNAMEALFIAQFDTVAGHLPEEAILDYYLPECLDRVDVEEYLENQSIIHDFSRRALRGIGELHLDEVDFGPLIVERTPEGIQVEPADLAAASFKINGTWMDVEDYYKLVGLDPENLARIETEPILFVERAGKVYAADCSYLIDIS